MRYRLNQWVQFFFGTPTQKADGTIDSENKKEVGYWCQLKPLQPLGAFPKIHTDTPFSSTKNTYRTRYQVILRKQKLPGLLMKTLWEGRTFLPLWQPQPLAQHIDYLCLDIASTHGQ